MTYKYSMYNHHGYLHDGTILVYNVLSSAVALMTQEEFNEIKFRDNYYTENKDLCRMAQDQGFIVPADEDEFAKVMALRNSNNFYDKRAGFQILPTTGCNARCFYCYEQDFINSTMLKETVDATINFILCFCENMDEVHVAWFGGEPFICEKTMAEISYRLISEFDKRGTRYYANVITNGALISGSNIDAIIREYRISNVQITLDGRGREHIKRKAFLDKSVTYERILQNISLLTKNDVQVMVRINIDRNNLKECLGVFEDLSTLDAKMENLWAYAAPLYSDKNDSDCLSKDELCSAFEKIYIKMIDCGFIKTVDGLPMNFSNATCFAKMLNNFVISPNGDISKCEHLLNVFEEVIGSVYSGIRFNSAMAKWCDPSIPHACKECSYLPICQAGCSAAEQRGFGYGRCTYIAFVHDAIIAAANYLIEKGGKINDNSEE